MTGVPGGESGARGEGGANSLGLLDYLVVYQEVLSQG